MFGSKKKETATNNTNKSKALPSSAPSINSLVVGTHVEGTIKSENDIRIDGSVKGTLNCKAKVIIGPSGLFEGEINCNNARIEGRFQGTLNVKDTLQIKDKAKVEGDINTDKLSVEPGAIFNVSCAMIKHEVPSKSSSQASKIKTTAQSSKSASSTADAKTSKEPVLQKK